MSYLLLRHSTLFLQAQAHQESQSFGLWMLPMISA